LNPEFCKDCYQDGKYTEPDITLTEMIVRKSKEMMEKNPRLPETTATGITTTFIPGLKRWNPEFKDDYQF
ncbi:MAG: zinc ribbon domain-containing protein, partial [Methanobrevibacter sp.]